MHDESSRALLSALYHAAVEGAAPFPRTRGAVSSWLQRERQMAPALARTDRVHVIALGKAAPAMFAGAVTALADAGLRPAGGVVVAANRPTDPSVADAIASSDVALVLGDHPVPGPSSLDAGDAIDEAVRAVNAGDRVIVLISGGATSLAAAPVSAFSQAVGTAERAQAHIANLAETLLESGLAIGEMNAIRRRLLRWGAGRLAVALHARGASRVAVFAISDVIGDDPSVIGSGPCVPDRLDDSAFLALVDAHQLRGALERDTAQFLGVVGSAGVPGLPPATHPAFALVQFELVARNVDAIGALADAARNMGVHDVVVDEAPIAGEASAVGDAMARRALAVARRLAPHARVLLVAGGEPVVNLRATLQRAWDDEAADDEAADGDAVERTQSMNYAAEDEPLRGGRMQVVALTASLALEDARRQGDHAASRITLLAAGTDGRDGPTDAAGAIVDELVPALARRRGRNPERDAETGCSYYPLDAAGALLRSGPTGTNVMDVVAILIA